MMRRENIPTITLERFRLGELPAVEAERVRRAVAADPRLREILEDLAASDREILEAHDPAWMAQQIRRKGGALDGPARAAAGRSRWFWWRIGVPAGAVAVALLLSVLPLGMPEPDGPLPDSSIRVKGSAPALVAHLGTSTGSETLRDGDRVRAGDQVMLHYEISDDAYGVIVSIDGRGLVTQHLPRAGNAAVWLEADGPRFLDHAYELDDAPRWEVFLLFVADAPFSVRAVAAALAESPLGSADYDLGRLAEDLRALPGLPAAVRVTSLTLNKETSGEF